MFDGGEVRGCGGDGVAAIAPNGERGADLYGAVGCLGLRADHSAAFVEQARNFVLHEEVEGRVLLCLRGDEVQEVPLRHEGDVLCGGGKVGDVDERKDLAADDDAEPVDAFVGNFEEGVEET